MSPDPLERVQGEVVADLERSGRPFTEEEACLLGPVLQKLGPWPEAAWLNRLAEYASWVGDAGRLPRFDGGTDELRWAAWAETQTWLALLSATRRHEITLRAPYLVDPVQAPDVRARAAEAAERARERDIEKLEERWRDRLGAYLAWATVHGRSPRRTSDDEEEAALGRWYADQRPKALTQRRARLLDHYLPRRDGLARAYRKELRPGALSEMPTRMPGLPGAADEGREAAVANGKLPRTETDWALTGPIHPESPHEAEQSPGTESRT